MASSRVLVERTAGDRTRGDYSCTECPWEAQNVGKDAARWHVDSAHGCAPTIRKRKLDESIRSERAAKLHREHQRRYEGRKKASIGRASRRANMVKVWPYMMTADNVYVTSATVTEGKGERFFGGALGPTNKEGLHVAVSFVAINASRLLGWFRAGGHDVAEVDSLFDHYTKLNLISSDMDTPIDGASGSACAAAALTLLLGGTLLMENRLGPAITGDLDLRGIIRTVGDVREKIQHCKAGNMPLVVAPAENLQRLEKEGWAEDDREYVHKFVKPARTFVDVLSAAFKDFKGTAEMRRELDGPHVGIGRCIGLLSDGVGDVEVQCCWVYPGNEEILMTGNLSDTSRRAIEVIYGCMQANAEMIGQRLGLVGDALKALSIRKPKHVFHVHFDHGYQPVAPSYQMGAIFVAMISLMWGRRPRNDTIIFGDVSPLGPISSVWDLNEEHIDFYRTSRVRRVILGRGTTVTDEAEAMAAVTQPDGRPLVELIVKSHVLDAVMLCFE